MTEIVGFQLADERSLFGAISLEAFVQGEFDGLSEATERIEISFGGVVLRSLERGDWPPIYRSFSSPPLDMDPASISYEVIYEDIPLTRFVRDSRGLLGWIGYGRETDTLVFWPSIESADEIGRTPLQVSALLTGRYRGPHGWG